jgi:indolepyruvate decarboxylase
MRGTVGEFLIERLLSNGIEACFGKEGDYNSNFCNKLYNSKVEVVCTTSEAAAGHAADAYARVKGMGCVCVTYGAGGFALANAIACAHAEKSPVVVISGSPGLKERNGKVLLHHMVGHFECQHKLFEHITCANTVLRDPQLAGYEIDRVLTAAQEFKQPVYIELPRDVVDKPIGYNAYTLLTPKEANSDEQNLNEATAEVIEWINSAKNPVIWAGVECGRFGISKKLIKFCEQTNIPIATTMLGKSVVNERHPLSLGVYCESTSTDELRSFMDQCDCLIMLGVVMTDMNTGFLPLKYQKRHIVNATSKQLQVKNHSFEDVKFTDFVETLFKGKVNRRDVPTIPAKADNQFVAERDKKITCSRTFDKINTILNSTTAIVADTGDSLLGAMDLTVHDSHLFISDAFYLSMGFAVPAALGIQTARPDVRPVVIVGVGAFQMMGLEFSTLVRRKSNAIIFVLNNGSYAAERMMSDSSTCEVQPWSYEKIPQLVGGGVGYKVTTEGELEEAIAKTMAIKGQPTIINIVLDQKDHTPALKRMFAKVRNK